MTEPLSFSAHAPTAHLEMRHDGQTVRGLATVWLAVGCSVSVCLRYLRNRSRSVGCFVARSVAPCWAPWRALQRRSSLTWRFHVAPHEVKSGIKLHITASATEQMATSPVVASKLRSPEWLWAGRKKHYP